MADINYDDKRFKTVESDKTAALREHEKLYDGMISNSDKFYDEQIKASKDWANTQTKLQNEQTDFAIEKIEQQKKEAKQDYLDEQSGAYNDWQKQSDKYGVRAEQIADKGMQNTGYAESSQVSMYNTYQNRVMTARESYTRAVQDFNNGITEARLQNNSALAEIRFKALQQQLELNLQGFQAKNQLLLGKANQKLQIEDSYYNRYQDVLNQINTENSLAEQIRQFNESMALQREQFEWQKDKSGFSSGSRGGGGGSGGSYSYSSGSSGSVGSAQINKNKSTGNSKSSGSLPADTAKSIIALGQGPISASNLANQVKSGKVTTSQSTSTGNTLFHNAGLQSPTSGLLFSKTRF
jgi:hypothetical protein